MSSCGLAAVLLLACSLTFTTAQSSCKGRCGMGYYRGYTCQCDYSCLFYRECCRDYESLCTNKNSCKGRCGETFKRGRPCSCDADCVKYNQCCPDYNEHCDELDPTPVATEQPTEGPLTSNQGNGPGDSFLPTVNPISYPQDDPDSASKLIFHNNPDPIALPEGSSGSPPTDLLEDLTTAPPLPDLDGFEIFPEPVTVSTETTAAPSEGKTTPGSTTAGLTSAASTAATTDIADYTVAPERSTVVSIVPTQPTSDPTTSFTDLQTDPTQTLEDLTVTSEPPLVSSETPTSAALTTEMTEMTETTEATTTSFTDPQTDRTQKPEALTVTSEPPLLSSETPTSAALTTETTEATTTSITEPQTDRTQKPEALTVTSEPPLSSSETPTSKTEITEETTTLEPSTIPPTTTNVETTTLQEKSTTESPSPATLTPLVLEMSTVHAELETTTAKGQDLTSRPTSSPMTTSTRKPEKPFKPVLSPENKPVLNGLGVEGEYQADDNNDTNLCSGRPISGLTTLSNGTVVVFRGHYFWVLDRNKIPGPARGITQVWGIPSPIDTVFTRCNCQGKTYIFKGPQYWRYENDVLDPGFPKVVQTGFDGLRGHITAALSVPQYNRRRESVYFFKRGGTVQKYSYQYGTNPSCGRKVHYAVYTHPNRIARQVPAQVSLLEPAINYRTSWKGFPTTITAAVSIPNKREPEGYSYYVFSRSKSYRIRIQGEKPVVVASKPDQSPQSNEVFKCPKRVSRSQ